MDASSRLCGCCVLHSTDYTIQHKQFKRRRMKLFHQPKVRHDAKLIRCQCVFPADE